MATDIKRRTFLKTVGLGAGAAVVSSETLSGPEAKAQNATDTAYGVLVDTRRCVNCKSCQIACKAWWDNETDPTSFKTDFTSQTWTFVQEYEQGSYDGGDVKPAFVKRQCMHCEEPACVSACPMNGSDTPAMQKLVDGPVVLDHENCIGCQMCIASCPFGVPKFDTGTGKVLKCKFCVGRARDGREPACVGTCPAGALQFGTLENIETLALQAEADGCRVVRTDPAGKGTSWMYVFEAECEVELTV